MQDFTNNFFSRKGTASVFGGTHDIISQSGSNVFLSHQISISHQPAVFFSHNKSTPATSHSQTNRVNDDRDILYFGQILARQNKIIPCMYYDLLYKLSSKFFSV